MFVNYVKKAILNLHLDANNVTQHLIVYLTLGIIMNVNVKYVNLTIFQIAQNLCVNHVVLRLIYQIAENMLEMVNNVSVQFVNRNLNLRYKEINVIIAVMKKCANNEMAKIVIVLNALKANIYKMKSVLFVTIIVQNMKSQEKRVCV